MTATTTTAAAPSTRLSTAAIVAIAFVAILVLGGIGALIGKSAESDTKLPTNLGSPISATNNLRAGTVDHLSAVPHSTATGAAPGDTAAGDSVTLGDNVVTVPVPPDWEATVGDDNFTVALSKPNFYAFVNLYTPDVKPDPAVVVSQLIDSWVRGNQELSDIQTTQIKIPADVDGYVYVLYSATVAGTSGSFSVFGYLDAFVRDDGNVLAVQRQSSGWTVQEAIDTFAADDSVTTIIQGAGDSFRNG